MRASAVAEAARMGCCRSWPERAIRAEPAGMGDARGRDAPVRSSHDRHDHHNTLPHEPSPPSPTRLWSRAFAVIYEPPLWIGEVRRTAPPPPRPVGLRHGTDPRDRRRHRAEPGPLSRRPPRTDRRRARADAVTPRKARGGPGARRAGARTHRPSDCRCPTTRSTPWCPRSCCAPFAPGGGPERDRARAPPRRTAAVHRARPLAVARARLVSGPPGGRLAAVCRGVSLQPPDGAADGRQRPQPRGPRRHVARDAADRAAADHRPGDLRGADGREWPWEILIQEQATLHAPPEDDAADAPGHPGRPRLHSIAAVDV